MPKIAIRPTIHANAMRRGEVYVVEETKEVRENIAGGVYEVVTASEAEKVLAAARERETEAKAGQAKAEPKVAS